MPTAPVVLDLVGVTFFGSAGLSVLLDHNERCAELGTRLQVIGSRTVNRVVVATGLADMLAVVPAEAPGPDERGRAADVRLPRSGVRPRTPISKGVRDAEVVE